MRFQQFVEYAVNPVVQAKHMEIGDLAVRINGGWEVWLQVEIYLVLRQLDSGLLSFEREPRYPASAQRADFNFVPRNADSTTTWVELKTEKLSNVQDAIDRFCTDVIKVAAVELPQNDTVGAVVCIATNVQAGLQYAREATTGITGRFSYYLISGRGVRGVFPLSRDEQVGQDEFAVIYYVRD